MAEISFQRTAGVLSEGVHIFRIVNVEEGQKGNHPYLTWEFIVEEGSDEDGKLIWDITSLAPQSRFFLENFLDAVGAPTEGRGSPTSLVGKRLRATVEHEEWNGRPRAQIKSYLPKGDTAREAKPSPTITPPQPGPSGMRPKEIRDDDAPF
jgi:hypothetical protein